ncbi:MAG: small multi-drug export protein [Bacteroidia bacterium]|nr:small multi-drug export protein [Bacteroidia bacterium]
MNEFWKIVQVILLSSVKFVAGPPFAYYDQRYDFTFFETVLYCVIGGVLGVIIFTFLSRPFFMAEHWLYMKIKKLFQKKATFSEPVADVEGNLEVHYEYIDKKARSRRIFTKRNRRVVKVWKKYGLTGIAIITPVLLSIPIGTILANLLESNKKKIILYMFFSILFWSLAMTTVFEILHVTSVKDLKDQVIP